MGSFRKIIRSIHFKPTEMEKEHFARKLVGFSSEDMFNVVADVKNYEQFVPFCTRSIIHSEGPDNLKASLEIGFPPISESYTSNVTLVKPKLVKAVCSDGRLFHYLENTWRFSFKSIIHSQIALFFFDNLVNKMEKAFIEEAERRYGRASVPVYPLEVVKT